MKGLRARSCVPCSISVHVRACVHLWAYSGVSPIYRTAEERISRMNLLCDCFRLDVLCCKGAAAVSRKVLRGSQNNSLELHIIHTYIKFACFVPFSASPWFPLVSLYREFMHYADLTRGPVYCVGEREV